MSDESTPENHARSQPRSQTQPNSQSQPTSQLHRTATYEISEYEDLLNELLNRGYSFRTFSETKKPTSKTVLLRHDVDLSVTRARAMAAIEATLGVRSTYCFLLTSPLYSLTETHTREALDQIRSMGHEIAVHFDTHSYWDTEPTQRELTAAVTAERTTLSRLSDAAVESVSFHIPPTWVLDRSFSTFTNTYSPPYFSEIEYCSDSSQKWVTEPPFADVVPETFQLLVHPGLWHPTHQSIDAILAEKRSQAHAAVDAHVDGYIG